MARMGLREGHFEHFGGMGPDMARMGLKRVILSTLAAWAQKWPEWASGILKHTCVSAYS